jgi:hypothetical protein
VKRLEELEFESFQVKLQYHNCDIFKYTLTEKGVATDDNNITNEDDSHNYGLNPQRENFFLFNGDVVCIEISVVGVGQPPGHIADGGCWELLFQRTLD